MVRSPARVTRCVGTASIILLALGACTSARADDILPLFNYSRLTRTFDGQLPIGQRFQIQGAVETNILAVKVESFGFENDRVPMALLSENLDEMRDAVDDARSRGGRDVVYIAVGWERASAEQTPATRFSVNHPRLYFGRSYLFLFTYYRRADRETLKAIARREVRRVFDDNARLSLLAEKGLTPDQLAKELFSATGDVIDAGSQLPVSIVGSLVTDLTPIARHATYRASQVYFDVARTRSLEQRLSAPPADARSEQLLASIAKQDWKSAASLAQSIRGALVQTQAQMTDKSAVTATIRELSDVEYHAAILASPPPGTLEDQIDSIVDQLPYRVTDTLRVSAYVNPFLQTMHERLPFLVSLDGGLAYVLQFDQLVPTIGLNLKFNPTDFDDPLVRTPEFSLIVGLAMTAPDDLDPDFRGIFSETGDQSLLVGFGARFPAISSLLRFQVGSIWYRQVSDNPLSDDLDTKVGFYAGASMNWDALDFAARLFSGRPTLTLGGK